MIPEQRVLLAVVNCAILDTCRKPVYGGPLNQKRKPENYRLETHARSAFEFIYGPGLETYCNWLEFDPGWLRNKLTDFMFDERVRVVLNSKEPLRVSEEQRRMHRFNYSIWKRKDNQCYTLPDEEKSLLPVKQVTSRFDPKDQKSDRPILSLPLVGKRQSRKISSGFKTFTSIAQCLAGPGTDDGEEL